MSEAKKKYYEFIEYWSVSSDNGFEMNPWYDIGKHLLKAENYIEELEKENEYLNNKAQILETANNNLRGHLRDFADGKGM